MEAFIQRVEVVPVLPGIATGSTHRAEVIIPLPHRRPLWGIQGRATTLGLLAGHTVGRLRTAQVGGL